MRNRSLLTHGMPDSVVVGGVTVPIQTDYRVGILVEAILRDGLLDAGTRAALIFRLYCGEIPEGTEPVLLWIMQVSTMFSREMHGDIVAWCIREC